MAIRAEPPLMQINVVMTGGQSRHVRRETFAGSRVRRPQIT
jgi:hypothetical protein